MFIFPFLIPKWFPYRITLFISLFLVSICTLLIAPVFAPMNLISMLIGLGVGGFPHSMLVIPNMPEMMQACKEAFPEVEDLDHANSLLSGMLNACFGAGQAIGPFLGAIIYQAVGFRASQVIFGSLALIYTFVYYRCVDGG